MAVRVTRQYFCGASCSLSNLNLKTPNAHSGSFPRFDGAYCRHCQLWLLLPLPLAPDLPRAPDLVCTDSLLCLIVLCTCLQG